MQSAGDRDATVNLEAASRGDPVAADALLPLIYDALRERAAAQLRRESPDHTLQPTALVNEVYLRLVDQSRVDWQGRTHFLAVAATTMRRILIDHARHRRAAKHGGRHKRVPLKSWIAMSADWNVELVDLADVLEKLTGMDARAGRIVELRFFGGLTEQEVGRIVGLSDRAVRKEWAWAKTWLRRELGEGTENGR